MVAGIGFGAGFQGAVRTVIPTAAPHERAGTLSIIFVVSYLALGVPAIAAGSMLTHGADIMVTAEAFCAVIMALAGAALLGATSFFRGRAPATARRC
jgi:hypothetical protein